MSKKDEKVVVEPDLVEFMPSVEEVPVAVPVEPSFTFDQFCVLRGKKVHHVGGMRAFCTDVHMTRSLKDWDKVFSSY